MALFHLNVKQITQIFRNVYITDGREETELDAVVLTDSGAIILEVKKVKSDLTLTSDGRMVFAGDECFDKMPLGAKMALKRRLLKKCLEKAVAEQGLDIPIYVDSFIVFSAPKGQHIQIDDRYRKEKHCFRTGLNRKIENYLGCAYYKAEQLTHLGSIFSEMETNAKRFKTELDYDEVRRNLAEALAILQNAVIEEQTQPVAEPATATVIEFTPKAKRSARKKDGIGVAIASIVTGVILSGASIWVAANGNRA